jgi:predicted transcriptional regulator
MGEKEWCPSNVLDLFGDSIARATLVIASEGSVSVPDIAEQLDVSDSTIYRRIDPLMEANLLKEHRRIDRHGNQHKEYETILDEVTFAIEDGSYRVDIQVNQDLGDDFESMWSDLESTSRGSESVNQPTSPKAKKGGDPS